MRYQACGRALLRLWSTGCEGTAVLDKTWARLCHDRSRTGLGSHVSRRQLCKAAETATEAATPSRKQGGLSWITVTATLGAAVGAYAYTRYEVDRIRAARLREQDKAVGVAQVGGPFTLTDTAGKPYGSDNLLGEFAILYFGFTHCPDVCPDELEKMAAALDDVEKRIGCQVQPVFVTLDPQRDTARLIKRYIHEFHPRMVGLRGSLEEIKKVTKLFRVYFMKTNDSKTDYLVDHSIIMYLLGPDGKFITFYGKNFTAEQITDSLCDHVLEWKKQHPEYKGIKSG